MHYGRILAVVGVVLAAVGFLLQSASSAGEAALAQLSQVNPDFPDGFDNTWTALYNDTAWAAIVFAIAGVASLLVALIPPLDRPMARLSGYRSAARWLGRSDRHGRRAHPRPPESG